tara:strand:- start:711 stop:1862 length:1152 start_codon:yes stop_codon:yes gene_type:complete
MTWTINPTVTVNGTSYLSSTVGSISINYGRTNIWDFQNVGYANITLVNATNTNYSIDINQSVVVKLKDYAGTSDITVFTGTVTQVNSSMKVASGAVNISYVQITAVGALATLARTQVGTAIYPEQDESERITAVIAGTSATVDTIDTGNYTLLERAINPNAAITIANAAALTATGSIYETASGKVGYANQARRNTDVATNGYFNLLADYINVSAIKSQMSLNDVINTVKINYAAGSVYAEASPTSVTTYGTIAGTLDTDISNITDVSLLSGIYLAMRAFPKTSLSAIEVRLDDPGLDGTTLNKMLNMYFGLPIQITSLPLAISATTYQGFVEGWNLTFSGTTARINLRTSEKTYSYRSTQWSGVNPALIWSAVGATLTWNTYD